MRSSESHGARKQLFQLGIQRGYVTVREIEEALPPGSLSPAERWLLYYSLQAADVEIRDSEGQTVPPFPPPEPTPP